MAYKAGSLVVDILANDQVSTALDRIGKKIGAFGKKSNRLSKNGGGFGFLKIAKWTAVFAVARRFGRVLGNIVQSGADYTETLNLWETAMGSNLNVATEFVNKMNEAYGISEKTLMNAQAIFKNMLGSLGQISDTMAYSLSEGITQMALDYASLYNQTFEQAFTKFQAALAGQVRPIRSVAGYDITENTLYQLYQSLGGTKTMRQLSRTEKQLLSILAIFNQMTASGAVGDLDKTMESFANQSRVMAESWQQAKTYAGVLLTYSLQESKILVYVNAILIFIGDTLKTVAESMGAIQHFGGDLFESTTESALGASEAIDEVQGKLLDFDKFRAMSSSEEKPLGLDEKLLNALLGYDTILANASMEARKLGKEINKFIEPLVPYINEIAIASEKVKKAIEPILKTLFSGFDELSASLVKQFSEFLSLLASIIDVFSPLINVILKGALDIFKPIVEIVRVLAHILYFGIFLVLSAFAPIIGAILYPLELILKIVSTIVELVASLFKLDFSQLGKNLSNIWTDWKSNGIISAIKNLEPPKFANGGMPDKGTLFRAGEAGAEIVYNTPSGQSGVVNVQQIQSAFNGALNNWWSNAKHDIPQFKEVSKTGIYEVAKSEMRRRGEW